MEALSMPMNIGYFFSDSLRVNMSPRYQRDGGIWSLAKKQLFIDSLLNGYDIPKIYFNDVKNEIKNILIEYKNYMFKFGMNEGKAYKATKNVGGEDKYEDKKELMRSKIEEIIKSNKCNFEQVGNDLEVICDDEHIAQVMFRKDYIGVKKVGVKFPTEFKYSELGKIKKELNEIIKSCCK